MNAGAFRDPLRYRGVLLMPPPTVHMVPYVTGGLKQIYLNIQNREARRVYEVGSYTDGRGHFIPQQGMPLLALRYNYLETLGKGQSSVIIKAEDTFHSNNLVAIKVLHTTYFPIGSQEVDIMLEVNKDDPLGYVPIIRLLNIFSFDDHYCLVFQLLQPDPITDHFKKLKFIKEKSLKAIREVTVKLLTVLGFLYRENIIHADLKPDNILLGRDEDTSFRVVDFGNAIRCVHDELSLYYSDFELQALIYRAPEVMFGLSFGLEVDMWSLGCILAELYIGEPLFLGRNKEEVLKKMVSVLGPLPREYQRGKFYFQYNQWIGNALPKHEIIQRLCQALHCCKDWAFVNFIAGLLAYKPEERLTPWAAANHSFIASYLPNLYLTPINYEPELYPRISLNHSNYQHQLKCEMPNGRHRQRWESYSLLKKKSKERLSNKNFQTVSPSHMEDLKISSGEAESLRVNISPSIEQFSSSSSQENLTSTGTLDQHSLSDSACNFTSKASNPLTELVSEEGSNSASPRTSSSVKSDTVLNGIKYKGFRSAAKPSSSQEASIEEMFSLRSKWFPPKNDDSESDNSSLLETSKGSNSKHLSCSTENQEKKFKSCKDTIFYQKDIKRKSLSKFREFQKGSKFEDTSFKSALKRPQDLPLFLDKNALQNNEKYSYFPSGGTRCDRIPPSFLHDDSQINPQDTLSSRSKSDLPSGRSLKSSSSKKSYSRPYMKRLPKEPKNNGDQNNGTYLNKIYHPLNLKTSLQKKSKQKSSLSVLSSSDIDCLSHPNNSRITHQQTCDSANIRLNVNHSKSCASSESYSNQDDDKMASLLRQSGHESRKLSKRLPGVSCGIKTNGLLQKDSRFKGKDVASTSKTSFPEAELLQVSLSSHNKSTQVEFERLNDSSGSSCMTVKDEAQCASELFDYRDHQSESSASWMEDYSSSSNSYSSGSPKQKGWHLLEPFNTNNPEDDVVLLLDSND